ncbi:hypothetical protein ACEWY4_003761 [Coilia grayii]|uniref:NACHT domain-containing protein n=1 Tax=Coilia grayii TaxID=363190 RepID=A0ABD1KS79_9TELE
MATSQDFYDSTDSWLNARSLHMQALLTPPVTPEGRSSLLEPQSPPVVLVRNQHTSLTAAVNPNAEEPADMDESGQCLDDVIATVLSSGDTPVAKRRVVVLRGRAGAGKSVSLEKLAEDWARGQVLQGYDLVLHVCVSECVAKWARKVREHSSVSEKEETMQNFLSLEDLLILAHPHLSSPTVSYVLKERSSSSTHLRLLLLLDGLDQTPHLPEISELLLTLPELPLCSDPLCPVPISHLLSSLAQGALLPTASLVITSRQVPDVYEMPRSVECVEVLGFSSSQRAQFFQLFLSGDGTLACKLSQLCDSVFSRYQLCSLPLFCWTLVIVGGTLQQFGTPLPETLTQLWAHITALSLTPTTSPAGPAQVPPARALLRGLAQLARVCSVDGRGFCSREELLSRNLEPFLSSPQLHAFLQEGVDIHGAQMFLFRCPMMQQFLVAVGFFLEDSGGSGSVEEQLRDLEEDMMEFGKLFVAGLSEPSQRAPLQGLLETQYAEEQAAAFQRWLEKHAQETLAGYSKERHMQCFHLLKETQNKTLVKQCMSSPGARLGISYGGLERADCAALSYVLSCAGEIQQLNLYSSRNLTSGHTSQLIPVFRMAPTIILSQSELAPASLTHLAEGLKGGATTHLDLSYCALGDEGLRVLCPALTHSSLHTLRIPVCKLTAACCKDLSAALAVCALHVLDLRGNKIADEGLKLISNALKSQQCKLQELSLHSCDVSSSAMHALSEALSCGHCALVYLDLTRNDLSDPGMTALSHGLSNPSCRIHTLKLVDCGLTGSCCAALASAVRSGGSLAELDVSCNDLGQEGALLLCERLKGPQCPLVSLSMTQCELTLPVFSALEEVLRGRSKLQSLALGLNKVGDRGARHLWGALKHTQCSLQDLDLEMIGLTDECVVELCEAVKAHGSLKTLILKNNSLTDSSVPFLVQLVQNCPGMKELNLQYNDLSEDVFEFMDSCSRIRY